MESFEEIYKRFHQQILAFVSKRVNTKEIAEDITHDVFEKVYRSLSDFKWQGIEIKVWVYRIAKNAIIDHYRRAGTRKSKSLDEVADFISSNVPSVEVELIGEEEEIALYNAMRELAEDEQYLIYYKFYENLNNKEIAQLMKMSETNVGTKLHRLRSKIKIFSDENKTKNQK